MGKPKGEGFSNELGVSAIPGGLCITQPRTHCSPVKGNTIEEGCSGAKIVGTAAIMHRLANRVVLRTFIQERTLLLGRQAQVGQPLDGCIDVVATLQKDRTNNLYI
jgi:hypothetical protein